MNLQKSRTHVICTSITCALTCALFASPRPTVAFIQDGPSGEPPKAEIGQQEQALLSPLDADVLRGVAGVNIYVVMEPQDALQQDMKTKVERIKIFFLKNKENMLEHSIRMDVQALLLKAGVGPPPRGATPNPGMPNLYIWVNTLRATSLQYRSSGTQKKSAQPSDMYTYVVRVWEAENVHLERAPGVTVMEAPIWVAPVRFGTTDFGALPSAVRREVKNLVDVFCRDYREANLKKAPGRDVGK